MERIDNRFVRGINILLECRGKVKVTGMGKSGRVGEKIASTLSSTGASAVFLHPAAALNGDLGIFGKQDVVIATSNSGETEEIVKLLLCIRRVGSRLTVLTGHLESTIARTGDVVLEIGGSEEACPLGLLPTANTTAAHASRGAIPGSFMEKKGLNGRILSFYTPEECWKGDISSKWRI
jgi:arabinose-5-phosphate isomerase